MVPDACRDAGNVVHGVVCGRTTDTGGSSDTAVIVMQRQHKADVHAQEIARPHVEGQGTEANVVAGCGAGG